jgi:D-tyrosyl-tRNA(Tyr) deacylase
MRLLIQRVSKASVTVDDKVTGSINRGFLVLVGFKVTDEVTAINKLCSKCLYLRIFEDEQSKMNRSILDIGGELLVISQFTLYANCKKGRRPGFDKSMPPEKAEQFYNLTIDEFKKSGLKVEHGIFGAKMKVELVNDGPVTIMLDDEEL